MPKETKIEVDLNRAGAVYYFCLYKRKGDTRWRFYGATGNTDIINEYFKGFKKDIIAKKYFQINRFEGTFEEF